MNIVLLLTWILILAAFFAKVEIQIEGGAGWAANLPTWRIEQHWLLDIFWGGRPITGYHAWIFSFMALVFHLGIFTTGVWSARLEARIIGSLMLFWIAEDYLWFVMNPAFGIARFAPEFVPWHKHWAGPVPVDYITFTFIGILLISWAFRHRASSIIPVQATERTH
ncbi:MAG: hypothetical protein HQM09_03735 [Candidatus Riflebacteria bacterium]|nr:hypothetical protein [Candidatus Riflebacteria bacterium]